MPLVKRDHPDLQAKTDPAASVESLLGELRDGDPARRRHAARLLGEAPQAAEALCGMLECEPHEAVREAVFTALIRLGTPEVAKGLVPLLESEDVALRNGAIEALKTMPAAVAEHIDAIFSSSTDVRLFGVEIIGALAHPDGPLWLLRMLRDEPALNVCAAAVDALAESGDARAVAPLRALLERFPDEPFLEFSVQNALSRIVSV